MATKKAAAKKTTAKKTATTKTAAKKSPARETGTEFSKRKPPPVQTQNAITPASENTDPPTRVPRTARKAVATTSAARASITATAARRAARAARGSSWT